MRERRVPSQTVLALREPFWEKPGKQLQTKEPSVFEQIDELEHSVPGLLKEHSSKSEYRTINLKSMSLNFPKTNSLLKKVFSRKNAQNYNKIKFDNKKETTNKQTNNETFMTQFYF